MIPKSKEHLARVDLTTKFELSSPYQPRGDQPQAIEKIVAELSSGTERIVLLGVTGSGKTFTAANIIHRLNRPALVLAHNKTLAAQLYSEFRELFPNNAVRYFVSYYDYYQPEAYVPSTDTYIEKDASVNDEIDKLRHAATKAILERRDVIVVASVSCIYGLGDPQMYFDSVLFIEQGDKIERNDVMRKLAQLQYERNDEEFFAGSFRVRGDVVEVCPASDDERSIRIEFFGNEIEGLTEIDRISGKPLRRLQSACIYPASHYVTSRERVKEAVRGIRMELKERLAELAQAGKTIEAYRLEQRTRYDLELLDEMGFCPGIENYSRHLTGRKPGEPPPTLLDYFPEDFLVFIDESHQTVPQLVGMYRGDRARKQTLVDYGFRLPSALDNRPLRFDEVEQRVRQVVYVSATPADFEIKDSKGVIVEQIIRPTGLVDPKVSVKGAGSQVEDFLEEVRAVVDRGERALVTVLTKKLAEHLTKYYQDLGVRVRYLHSDVHTLDRIELIRGLRQGEFDLLVGINLLREGLDIPEVSLVGIMDADKEGFLRSGRSLIQTIGRAARNVNGHVILYADTRTQSIEYALAETDRRRKVQADYNAAHGIIPQSVKRAPEAVMIEEEDLTELKEMLPANQNLPQSAKECQELITQLRKEMFRLAKEREFEQAAVCRDRILLLEKYLLTI